MNGFAGKFLPLLREVKGAAGRHGRRVEHLRPVNDWCSNVEMLMMGLSFVKNK